jgi:hypothetical protein
MGKLKGKIMKYFYLHRNNDPICSYSAIYFLICILLFSGCVPLSVPIIFEPKETEHIKCIYSKGQAIAAVKTDEFSFLCFLDKADIGGVSYLRMWVLCNNRSDSLFLLEPTKMFQLEVNNGYGATKEETKKQLELSKLIKSSVDLKDQKYLYPVENRKTVDFYKSLYSQRGYSLLLIGETPTDYIIVPLNEYPKSIKYVSKEKVGRVVEIVDSQTPQRNSTLSPEKPSIILNHIENQKLIANISTAIGGWAKELSTKPTTITTETESGKTIRSTVNDAKEKRAAVRDETDQSISSTSYWYDTYNNSVSQGLLRKNTIFPNQSVNGYICFPADGIQSGLETEYQFLINIPKNICIIKFSIMQGE